MRPLTTAFVVLLMLTSARAADLTGVLADYVTGKIPPTQESVNNTFGAVFRVWTNPKEVGVGRMVLMYTPTKGTDYWSLILYNYQLRRNDYLGTDDLIYLGVFSATKASIYRLNGGRFKGFYIQDEKEKDGSNMLFLYTPQAYSLTPIPSGLVK